MTTTDRRRDFNTLLGHFDSLLEGVRSGEATFTAPYYIHHTLFPACRFNVLRVEENATVVERQYAPGIAIFVDAVAEAR